MQMWLSDKKSTDNASHLNITLTLELKRGEFSKRIVYCKREDKLLFTYIFRLTGHARTLIVLRAAKLSFIADFYWGLNRSMNRF